MQVSRTPNVKNGMLTIDLNDGIAAFDMVTD